VCLGEPKLGLWRLADSYQAAQMEVLGVAAEVGGTSVVSRNSQPQAPLKQPASRAAPTNELRQFQLPRKPTRE